MEPAGLLAYSLLMAFPYRLQRDSGMQHQQFTELTATGIAPDLHRLPILIPQSGNPFPLQMYWY